MAKSLRGSGNKSGLCEVLEPRTLLSVLPSGFSDTLLASAIVRPTTMSIAPDGRVFVATQTGAIRVIDNGVLQTEPFVTLNANNIGDNGVLSVAFDPNFASNKFIYVNYITGTAPIHSRISRFSAAADTVSASSETVIFDRETQSNTPHQSGLMAFGNDGKLYITTGDEETPSNAQTLSNTRGKLLRVNLDGSIPSDNPFYSTATGINRAIFATGLRNPFGLSTQAGSGRMFVNDVGEDSWEEVDQVIPGANYGWPNSEGPTTHPGETTPIYAYDHTHGAAVVGAAFNASPSTEFPSAYAGKFFYGDFVANNILYFDPAAPPANNGAAVFATGLTTPQDLDFAPDGSLIYLQRGTGNDTGSVHRISFAVQGSAVPVSSLTPTLATNGWGPYERNMSNGEQAAGDGHAITLNGFIYGSGLGVHAASELDYSLSGAYARFRSDIGIDDEVGSAGNVIFQVFVDGVTRYDSGSMTGASTTRQVDLDVTGGQKLQLIVLANGDTASDHADWADARLIVAPPAWLQPSADASYTLSANVLSVTAGTVRFVGDSSATNPKLTVNVSGSAIVQFATDESLGALTLSDGASAVVLTNGNYVEKATALNIGSGARFDLSNNLLILDYSGTSPAFDLIRSLVAGRNGGVWNGSSGITSSAVAGVANSSLGYAEASAILGPNGGTFAGQTVDGTALLVRFTLLGDANLDRKVDVVDLGNLSSNWQKAGSWVQGDFNYDGKVDIVDLGVLSGDWQKTYTPPTAVTTNSGKTVSTPVIVMPPKKGTVVSSLAMPQIAPMLPTLASPHSMDSLRTARI